MLLLPQIPFGFETHHLDFPGTIDIHSDHLLNFVLDVTRSVAHHGFERILIADGHGSNMPILDMVARRTILETLVANIGEEINKIIASPEGYELPAAIQQRVASEARDGAVAARSGFGKLKEPVLLESATEAAEFGATAMPAQVSNWPGPRPQLPNA
jgi:hypothetical protein